MAEDFHRGKHQHVYHYYKTLYKPPEDTLEYVLPVGCLQPVTENNV